MKFWFIVQCVEVEGYYYSFLNLNCFVWIISLFMWFIFFFFSFCFGSSIRWCRLLFGFMLMVIFWLCRMLFSIVFMLSYCLMMWICEWWVVSLISWKLVGSYSSSVSFFEQMGGLLFLFQLVKWYFWQGLYLLLFMYLGWGLGFRLFGYSMWFLCWVRIMVVILVNCLLVRVLVKVLVEQLSEKVGRVGWVFVIGIFVV